MSCSFFSKDGFNFNCENKVCYRSLWHHDPTIPDVAKIETGLRFFDCRIKLRLLTVYCFSNSKAY